VDFDISLGVPNTAEYEAVVSISARIDWD